VHIYSLALAFDMMCISGGLFMARGQRRGGGFNFNPVGALLVDAPV
jgi:hypothetical protein